MDDGSHQRNKAVEAEFDEKASDYESNRLAAWYKAQGDVVLSHLEDVSGSVVDVGCGTGWLLRRIVANNPNTTGIGVDLSGRMIATAQERARADELDRLSFIHGDWEDSTTRNLVRDELEQPVSAIVCVSTFHYFHDPEAATSDMYDLLAPEGKIYLLDRAMDGSMGTFVWDILHRYAIKDGTRFYRTDELARLLEQAGCKDVRVLNRVSRLFWKGKLHTSLSLVSGRRGGA